MFPVHRMKTLLNLNHSQLLCYIMFFDVPFHIPNKYLQFNTCLHVCREIMFKNTKPPSVSVLQSSSALYYNLLDTITPSLFLCTPLSFIWHCPWSKDKFWLNGGYIRNHFLPGSPTLQRIWLKQENKIAYLRFWALCSLHNMVNNVYQSYQSLGVGTSH